jgi:hypothetical protein
VRGGRYAAIEHRLAIGVRLEQRQHLGRKVGIAGAFGVQIRVSFRFGQLGRVVEKKLDAFPARAIDGCTSC